ncbi:MAG: alpha/beta hydrolase [Gammaproteobacteria bacterium RIFCSPHIGHO2_12_FULL_37_14]|nr:MAG: alpha/beta hydrolase [Gammaproteobacteria bacterium RIFCSPHIGHO2_12_FULL_37_14]
MNDNQFKPAWWLPNSHLQTLWPVICRRNIKNLPIERERLDLPDGDFVDLDWIGRQQAGPLVLILHGLEGSIDSHYAKGMLKTIYQQSWRGVFMHFRGCSGEPNRLPRSYHSGETGDVEQVIKILLNREPDLAIAVVGFSLGGNVLLKWLGETGINNPLKAAIAISVPFELHKAAARIQKGFSKFYQWYFMKCLRERLSYKFQVKPPHVDPLLIYKVNSMYEFDDKITAPLHGFSGVSEYYSISSSRQYLRNICVPTLILHAKDDPFMTEDTIPAKHELSSLVQLEVTEAGGHVGFVSGKYPWKPEYWLEKRVPGFLEEHLSRS